MSSTPRLAGGFIPEHYDLSIKFHRVKRVFDGVVAIKGGVPSSINQKTSMSGEIRLHAKDLTIKSVTLNGKDAKFALESGELVISHESITAGKHIIVVAYEGKITDEMSGVYPCYFKVDGHKKELIATQFESHYARQAFPCVDEPEAKATFDVTLTTELEMTVLGNMPVKTQNNEDGWLVTRFETTPRMSTYLVAWVVGELQKKTAYTKRGVEVSIWATLAQPAESLDFALNIATRAIDFFEEYFGVQYPLPKSDHVALPDFSSGAMENWGLITYREIALLVDPKRTSLSIKQRAATVITHELSHQWFGNLVTMRWWNDLWLNESFANMMEYLAVDALEHTWDIWLDFATLEIIGALRRDSLDGVQSIQTEVNHPDEIRSIFDPSIVYAKGGRLLRMLQAYIGDDALRRGLKVYFGKHMYQNTEARDLWNALGAASGKDISGLMHAWMTQPGFPVVSAVKNGDEITLSQKQFFIGEHQESNRVWPIPLHGSSKDVPSILESENIKFSYTNPEPFRLNLASTAHFITHYDAGLLAEIIKNIESMPPIDRLGFLNEQLMLAKAGVGSYADIVALIQSYKNETNEAVWNVVALAINELKRFVETNEEAEKKLRELVASIVTAQYARLGWGAKKDEPENDTKLRSLIINLAIYGEVPDALKKADQQYLNNKPETLDPELRSIIMANAVRRKIDDKVVETLLSAYKKASNSELKNDICSALTVTKDENVIKKLVALMTDSKIVRPQDFIRWFVWLLRNRYGRDYMWQWVRDNWSWVVQTFKNDMHYDSFPSYIGSALVTAKQAIEFQDFFKKFEDDKALARNIKIGYTEIQATVALLKADSNKVFKALTDLDL